ncbi:MAG: helix-turn-helix domain-containing protein [Pseudomonadota bacterium]
MIPSPASTTDGPKQQFEPADSLVHKVDRILGGRIRATRIAHGLPILAISQKSGIDPVRLDEIESGNCQILFSEVALIANAINVDIGAFLPTTAQTEADPKSVFSLQSEIRNSIAACDEPLHLRIALGVLKNGGAKH